LDQGIQPLLFFLIALIFGAFFVYPILMMPEEILVNTGQPISSRPQIAILPANTQRDSIQWMWWMDWVRSFTRKHFSRKNRRLHRQSPQIGWFGDRDEMSGESDEFDPIIDDRRSGRVRHRSASLKRIDSSLV